MDISTLSKEQLIERRDLLQRKSEIESQQPTQEKPDLLSTWGMKPTPEQEQKQPYMSATAKTINEAAVIPALHFMNVAGFNLPRAQTESMGMKYPEAETGGGQILSKSAGLLGLPFSPIGGAIGAISKVGGAAAPLSQKLARGATAGALGGAAWTPPKDTPIDMGLRASVGAAAGAVLSGVGAGISKRQQRIKPPEIAEKVRGGFFDARKEMSNKFGKDLERLTQKNPDKVVSMSDSIAELTVEMEFNPQIRRLVEKVPQLKSLVDNPKLAEKIPLKESQDIINAVGSKLGKYTKYYNYKPEDRPFLELVEDIKGNQLEAFPEMEDVRMAYAQTKQAYNLLRNRIREGSLLNNLANDWGDAEIAKRADELLSLTKNKSEITKLIKQYKGSIKATEMLGAIKRRAGYVATGTAASLGIYQLLKAMGMGRDRQGY